MKKDHTKSQAPAKAATPAPRPATPVTTKRDIERNTYTLGRSRALREGNISAR